MSDNRLSKNNTALLLVDHQVGLANGIQDQALPDFTNALTAILKISKTFDLPTIATTSAADGPNGPLMPVINEILPNVSVIHRPGEINAFDNKEFAAAVKATGRKNLIVAGISTDVCANFVAMSALDLGYKAHVAIDACGTWNKLVQEITIARMIQAGVVPNNWVSIGAELQRDWREPTGEEFGQLMATHLHFYGNLFGTFMAASAASK